MSEFFVEVCFVYFGKVCDVRGIVVNVNLGNYNEGLYLYCW